MSLALLLAYDGAAYHGYQRQAATAEPTVQGTLEATLARLAGAPVPTVAAGRTDAGVHASGQVVTFAPPRPGRFTPADWQRGLNALLPPTIAVRAATAVAEGVSARFSANARAYRYRVLVDRFPDPLRQRYVWRVPRWPDVAAMQAGCATLLGEHDFAAFGHNPNDQPGQAKRHTIRWLTQATVARHADEIWLDFAANAFLTGMVRRMTQTVMRIGQGDLTPAVITELLLGRGDARSNVPAPACGLCLTRVAFPPGTITWPADTTMESTK